MFQLILNCWFGWSINAGLNVWLLLCHFSDMSCSFAWTLVEGSLKWKDGLEALKYIGTCICCKSPGHRHNTIQNYSSKFHQISILTCLSKLKFKPKLWHKREFYQLNIWRIWKIFASSLILKKKNKNKRLYQITPRNEKNCHMVKEDTTLLSPKSFSFSEIFLSSIL